MAAALGVLNIEFNSVVFDTIIWVLNLTMRRKTSFYHNHVFIIDNEGNVYKEFSSVYKKQTDVNWDNSIGFENGVPAGYKILVLSLCFN